MPSARRLEAMRSVVFACELKTCKIADCQRRAVRHNSRSFARLRSRSRSRLSESSALFVYAMSERIIAIRT